MANKRMFSKAVIESDAFLDMPISAQALYFHLGLRADDDGFVGNPKSILREIQASKDDLQILIAKSFIIAFESGVIAITHWRVNNMIRKDRYKPTLYREEYSRLTIEKSRIYEGSEQEVYQPATVGQPNDNHWLPQYRLDKNRLDKNRLDEGRSDKIRADQMSTDNGGTDRAEYKGYIGEDKREKNTAAEVLNVYEKLIGIVTSGIIDDIDSFIGKGMEPELIIRIIEYACERNARNWQYIQRCIINNLSEGIKTLADYNRKEADRAARKAASEKTDPTGKWCVSDEDVNLDDILGREG